MAQLDNKKEEIKFPNIGKILHAINLFLKRKSLKIVFLGTDGSGKSTLIKKTNQTLKYNFRTK